MTIFSTSNTYLSFGDTVEGNYIVGRCSLATYVETMKDVLKDSESNEGLPNLTALSWHMSLLSIDINSVNTFGVNAVNIRQIR